MQNRANKKDRWQEIQNHLKDANQTRLNLDKKLLTKLDCSSWLPKKGKFLDIAKVQENENRQLHIGEDKPQYVKALPIGGMHNLIF